MPASRSSTTSGDNHVYDTRFAHLESSLGNVAVQLGDYIKESKEHRDRVENEQNRIWNAIEKQGANLQSAVDKLSSRGQMSWPVIMSTITLVIVLVSAGATVNSQLTEGRIKQIEIRSEGIREVREANSKRLEEQVTLVDYHSVTRHDAQESQVTALTAEMEKLHELALDDAELRGKLLAYDEWLRDDSEATKDDLNRHIEMTVKDQSDTANRLSQIEGRMAAVINQLDRVDNDGSRATNLRISGLKDDAE